MYLPQIIVNTIRRRFDIPTNTTYILRDAADGTMISFIVLQFPEKESIVRAEIRNAN